jgi:hypothetical protein
VLLESGQRLRLLQALDLTTVVALTPQDDQAILEGPLFRGFGSGGSGGGGGDNRPDRQEAYPRSR